MFTLLVCTVGGSPEPVVASLKHWRPERVLFLHTPQTGPDIEEKILPKARAEGASLDPGRYDAVELRDGQDLGKCLEQLRLLTPRILEWLQRGEQFRVVVDFTGGTKCMSAALVLQASRWPCTFSYVGGKERTKDGVGVVVSGTETVLHEANPWDALGHHAVEDFVVLFDQHAFCAAAEVAGKAKKHVGRPDRKRELSVLENLAQAFDAWDRFDHRKASNEIERVMNQANDLRAVLGTVRAENLLEALQRASTHLQELCAARPPSRFHLLDLLANAKRRHEEGRFDDAVARLYRAIETSAQVALKERHGLENTETIPLEGLPEPLRTQWANRARQGLVMVGLQDAYTLLAALGDPLAATFQQLELSGTTSPLVARNRSILAHGFERVSEAVVKRLWEAALSLADVSEGDLPSFPSIGLCP